MNLGVLGKKLFVVLCLIAAPCIGRADVAVLMLEATGIGAARYTAAGHAAVYLSNVCPESPVKLRLCSAGEQGSVISKYNDFGEAESFEWNLVPVSVFLYGVEDEKNIPIYGDPSLRRALQERYRQRFFQSVCPPTPCGTGRGRWRDMVGATFTRDIYAFRVKTSREQDKALIDEYNSAPNVNRYNGMIRNCADFTKMLVNRYFPGAARPDLLNDFGMTSPKAVAKSFAEYGKKHPELQYTVDRYTQRQGPIRRSLDNRKGTEVGFRAKKWFIPLLVVRSHYLIYMAAAYYLTGRFNPDQEYRSHGEPDLSPEAEREAWESYKGRFRPVLVEAVRDGVFTREKDVDQFFRRLKVEGKTGLDENGEPILQNGTARVGLTRETLTGPGSDRLLAERLMLAKINATLKAPAKDRVSLRVFREDWETLEELGKVREARMVPASAGN